VLEIPDVCEVGCVGEDGLVETPLLRELVRGELSQAGGIVVGRGGEVFVTDGMFTGGRLLRIRP